MSESKLLECVEINPKLAPVGTLICLHGLGADSSDFVPIVQELELHDVLPLRYLFPTAQMQPVTINNGFVMRAWYDIYSINFGRQIDAAGVATSVQQLNALIEKEEARGIPSENIVIAGFSQGAVMALKTGLDYPKKLAGIVALSGYLPFEDEWLLNQSSQANKHTPIFLAHGTQDMVVDYSLGLSTYDRLQRHQYKVDWHTYNMAHSLSSEEIHDIGQWLQKIFVGKF